MRGLLVEHLAEAATKRTVAAITERNPGDTRVADAGDDAAPKTPVRAAVAPPAPAPIQTASAAPEPVAAPSRPTPMTTAPAPAAAKEPAPLTSGVISSPLAAIPGSSEPMQPTRIKTVQVRMTQPKAGTTTSKIVPPTATSAIPVRVADASADVPSAAPAVTRNVAARSDFPAPLPIVITRSTPGLGTGTLGPTPGEGPSPASSMAYADPSRGPPPTTLGGQAQAMESVQRQPAAAPQVVASAAPQPDPAMLNTSKPVVRSGWIIQVGALESENEARQRIEAARESARRYLSRANPFTEVFSKGSKTYYRARFAGLDQDSAEAACKTLKRADISCMTVRN
jgi:D-alanyl-D-alanine carboxypeptidase